MISFNESVSSNINGYNIDIRSTTRDYIGFGSYLSKGFPFSNWSFRVGGLEKIGFIKPYVSSMSLEHSFSGKQNLSWKFNEQGIMPINLFNISSFENGNDDYLQFSRISRSFSPLIGISTTFNNGISVVSGITRFRDYVLVDTGATVGFGDSIFIPDDKKISA